MVTEIQIGWFGKGLRNNGTARRDSIDEDYCKGKDGADGTFLRRHCGNEVYRIDQVRHRRTVSDVNSAKKRHFLRSEFGP
jgi:hypothetical protein